MLKQGLVDVGYANFTKLIYFKYKEATSTALHYIRESLLTCYKQTKTENTYFVRFLLIFAWNHWFKTGLSLMYMGFNICFFFFKYMIYVFYYIIRFKSVCFVFNLPVRQIFPGR